MSKGAIDVKMEAGKVKWIIRPQNFSYSCNLFMQLHAIGNMHKPACGLKQEKEISILKKGLLHVLQMLENSSSL